MDIADLIASEPSDISIWMYRVYDRLRGQAIPEREWSALFEFGRDLALRRNDMAGLHAMLSLAANYFDSRGDQFGCLPYLEDTMERVAFDPTARSVVLAGTHEILIGNS